MHMISGGGCRETSVCGVCPVRTLEQVQQPNGKGSLVEHTVTAARHAGTRWCGSKRRVLRTDAARNADLLREVWDSDGCALNLAARAFMACSHAGKRGAAAFDAQRTVVLAVL